VTFNPVSKPKTGLSALVAKEKERLEEEAKLALAKRTEDKKNEQWAPPEAMLERLRVIFDDSGSMGSTQAGTKLDDAKEGTVELLKNCIPNQTSVAVHPMEYRFTDLTKLTTNLPALSVLVRGIPSGGGTPLFETLKHAQLAEPKATRYIVFSDGSPDHYDETSYKEDTIKRAIEEKTPVDTVLIWQAYAPAHYTEQEKKAQEEYSTNVMKASKEYKLLQELAERTSGYFLVFDRNKMDFKQGLKYLAPKLRLALMNEQVRKDLEAGKLK